MKKTLYFALCILALASCKAIKEEWEPVFISDYPYPAPYTPVDTNEVKANTTIADLVALYTTHGKPLENMAKDLIIAGRISSSDSTGNFYKSFYIQDETGGIEIKIGQNGLYNDYKLGQKIYVRTNDLTLGEYGFGSYYGGGSKKIGDGNGMIQLGFYSPPVTSGTWYETSYMENKLLIDKHVLRADVKDLKKVTPVVLQESELPKYTDTQATNHNLGKRVRLNGLMYSKEIFCLLYIDPTKDKSKYNPSNRVFLSNSNGVVDGDKTHKVNTWAMSKINMAAHLCNGDWDACKVGSGSTFTGQTVADFKGDGTYPGFTKDAYSISHYFKMGSTNIIIRTSGYAKFADVEMPEDVYAGNKSIDVVGVITLYEGSLQITINDLSDIYVDGEPLE